MSTFQRILQEVRAADAQEQASKTIQAASKTSEREARVQAAQAHFRNIGLHSFFRAEAEVMRAEGFWCESHEEGVSDRASASVAFVPRAGEGFDLDPVLGRMNEYSLIIQAYGGEDVDCRFCSRAVTEHFARDLPLSALTLPLVKEWYERFVRLAFEKCKQAETQ